MRSDECIGVIELTRADRRYLPGEVVEGTARWSLRSSSRRIVVRLGFRISCTGEMRATPRPIAELSFADPLARGGCEFRFKLPAEPYSFDGRLFSIVWAVDLRAARRLRGDRRLAVAPLTMSPSGAVISSVST